MSAKVQRLRVMFARGEALRFVGHLDLQRFWERALRRAGLVVSYSEGFTPHPQITLGAPLPTGMTAEADLIDVYLAEPVAPAQFAERLQPQLPAGVTLRDVQEVPVNGTATQALLRAAEFEVALPVGTDCGDIKSAVSILLKRETVPWEQQREKDVKRFDLRPLIEWLRVDGEESSPRLVMRLRAEPGATGRPDHVAAALGIRGSLAICRLRLILADDSEMAPIAGDRGIRA